MKQAVPWLIVVGCVGVTAGYLLRGHQAQAIQAPAPGAGDLRAARSPHGDAGTAQTGKIVHTFEDEPKAQAFARLWQQRQDLLARMTMLQAYWNIEQASLTALNTQFTSQYQIDPSRRYTLDPERRVLSERKAPPAADQSPPASGAQAAPESTTDATPSEGGEEQVVHTFADTEAVQVFVKLWQQRQATILRASVLEAYWREEQATLAKLNTALDADYKVDATKTYSLDADRRVLIEREAPATPQLEPAAALGLESGRPSGSPPQASDSAQEGPVDATVAP